MGRPTVIACAWLQSKVVGQLKRLPDDSTSSAVNHQCQQDSFSGSHDITMFNLILLVSVEMFEALLM